MPWLNGSGADHPGFPDQWINLCSGGMIVIRACNSRSWACCSDLDMDGMHGLLTQLEQVEALRSP